MCHVDDSNFMLEWMNIILPSFQLLRLEPIIRVFYFSKDRLIYVYANVGYFCLAYSYPRAIMIPILLPICCDSFIMRTITVISQCCQPKALSITILSSQLQRSAATGTLLVPRARAATGQRSFAVNGPAIWNRLPPALQSPDLSDSAFKRALKTHLFSTARRH